MTTWITRTAKTPAPATIRVVRVGHGAAERTFTGNFCIGRDEDCDVQVDSGIASRRHAEVQWDGKGWRLTDAGSTNGTYVDGTRVEGILLTGKHRVRIGEDGPELDLIVEAANEDVPSTSTGRAPEATRVETVGGGGRGNRSADDPLSVTGYIQRYFTEDDDDAGDHTRMLRQAYKRVNEQNKRKNARFIAAGAAIVLLAIAYAGVQHLRASRLEARAGEAFQTMKQLDVQTARLQMYIESRDDAELDAQLNSLMALRQNARSQYEGYVEELGLRRRLTDEERAIYRVARIFNESEFEMPAMFVRAVRETIHSYWLTPAGRSRFRNAVVRAEELGYTPEIVSAMWRRGLPPEFFYLALQESNFDPQAIGPRTRWGIAKGMWQFIPETARAYGLVTGPREDQRAYDPQDQRHEVPAATDAASRYLLEIYAQLTQASGLLAMASYNWGERRVVGRLRELMEDIPDDPHARSYWRFLTEYSDRMPDETKDYVLKIFAAAVIGQDPRLFGFDFDNPLQPYIEAVAANQTRS